MSTDKRPWWRGFDKLERAIGEPLERAAVSNRYVDLMVRGIKLQRAIGGRVGGVASGATSRVLKAANIPTRSDIRRLSQQLAVLTQEVRELSADQHEALRATARTARTPNAATAEPSLLTQPIGTAESEEADDAR